MGFSIPTTLTSCRHGFRDSVLLKTRLRRLFPSGGVDGKPVWLTCVTIRPARRISQDGQWALSGGFEFTARFWNVATGKAVDFDPHTHMYGGGLSPDGRLALTAGGDQLVRLWNMPGRVELARYAGHSGHVYAAIFSPDGRRILSGDATGEVRLWDTKTAQELHCYRGHTKPISRLAFSPDGRYGLSSGEDDTVRLLGLPP